MKISDKPTAHILVKTQTNSEWDNCSFAIVHLSEDWEKEQAKRLELVKPLEDSSHFCSMNFYDTAVDFYGFDEMLAGKEWVFVEKEYQRKDRSFSDFDIRQKAYWTDIHEKLTTIKKGLNNKVKF